MGRKTEQTFFQRGNADGKQAHEKMFNIAIYQEMHIKTTMRSGIIPIRMTILKKKTNIIISPNS